ncbi:Os03g0734600 [Oryza sativa Japonica Group]|uniref:Os03g0734600 protein n=3 Tax=Oryza TaxID=4527 RepID=Q10DB7_ORYSJ|nr:hypothetical protein [Oryza sativa Japonica Group]ABF98728.1 hypothetical protein LOC_Os03g52420 [Oryza sativa Japonica Group]BAH92361.1 Os03g0734600 [Oryza sativa Japonica Group]|eukprot:NP_001173633.1 Os03g0734600 [Oryza sativa Japonica Group]
MCTPWVLLPACGLLLHFANAAPVARRGAAAGLRGRWWSDGSAKGAGGARSGEVAGGWWNGRVLGQLLGMADWMTGRGASVGCGGSHVPPMFRWWIRMERRTTAVKGSERKLSPILWASNGYAFKRGNPPEGIVEVPLPPRQEALGENLVQDFGRMMTASFGVATLMRALF